MPSPSRRLEELRFVRRWTEEDGQVATAAFRASGLSVAEFAEQHGLHAKRVERWVARLASSPLLLPVDVRPTATPRLVEIALGARILRVPTDLDDAQLARLVRIVESVLSPARKRGICSRRREAASQVGVQELVKARACARSRARERSC